MAEPRLDSGSEPLPLVFPNQTCYTGLKCIIILSKKIIIPWCHSSQELGTRGLTHLDKHPTCTGSHLLCLLKFTCKDSIRPSASSTGLMLSAQHAWTPAEQSSCPKPRPHPTRQLPCAWLWLAVCLHMYLIVPIQTLPRNL